jgi:DNA binding domain, excisionase family
MLNNYPDVLTVKQAAEALCISTASVYRLIHEHVIGSKRVGRKILIPKLCLIDYLSSARYNVSKQQ